MSPKLQLPRHESFARRVAAGQSASRAYRESYDRPPSQAVRACAARLLTKSHIRQRIAELRAQAVEHASASIQRLIPLLEERARQAISAGRLRDATSVLDRLSKLASSNPDPR